MYDNKQLLEQLHSFKSFHLDNSFEIFFEKQFIVPYSNLDDFMEIYPEYGGDAIYMVLQADRLELTNIFWNHDPPIIQYRNCVTGQTHEIDNVWFFSQPIYKDALHMKIVSGTLLEIGIKENWRSYYSNLQRTSPIRCSIYDLVTQRSRTIQTVSDFQLLYIGSSQNVFERLTNHKTILKIYRHTAALQPNMEIFVWILKPKQKLLKQRAGEGVEIVLSDSVWPREGTLGMEVDTKSLLLIAEAMLIHYFKPEYNEQYVRTLPNAELVVYSKLYDAGVRYVQVNLNLYMQTFKTILSIKSKTIDTDRAKHITIYGAVEDLHKRPKEDILSVDVMPEELYSLFFGEDTIG